MFGKKGINRKKYKISRLLPSMKLGNKILYRIVALKDFDDVKKGDVGGFVESKANLSQEGNCWIYDDAKVCDKARISDNAKIYGNSRIRGSSKIYDNAIIGVSKIDCNIYIGDYVRVYENSVILSDVYIYDHANICGKALITGIRDGIHVTRSSVLRGYTTLSDRAMIVASYVSCHMISGFSYISQSTIDSKQSEFIGCYVYDRNITENIKLNDRGIWKNSKLIYIHFNDGSASLHITAVYDPENSRNNTIYGTIDGVLDNNVNDVVSISFDDIESVIDCNVCLAESNYCDELRNTIEYIVKTLHNQSDLKYIGKS